MNTIHRRFLEAMGAAVKNEQVCWQAGEVTGEQWQELFHMAQVHRVMPMLVQAVFRCPAAQAAPELMSRYRMLSRQQIALQTRNSARLLPVLEALQGAGLHPLVVKGIVCRALYPMPDLRFSNDEDILVPREAFSESCRVLASLGLEQQGGTQSDYEISFIGPGGQLIELHQSLFPPESEAYGDLNRFFEGVHQQPVLSDGIPTPAPTEHLLYLILHAYKHFLHSGFGIRQVCDISLFANAFGSGMDWQHILDCCRQVRAEKFAAALFQIGRKHLGFSVTAACWPEQWQQISVDEGALLEDILRAGVYGNADMSRKHSSGITLQAVSARDRKGRGQGLRRSLFPPAKALEEQYTYLKDKPVLLPLAWTQRLIRYGRETTRIPDNSPIQSIRIGNARVELLRQYGILDKE